jgi:hypothetical protein
MKIESVECIVFLFSDHWYLPNINDQKTITGIMKIERATTGIMKIESMEFLFLDNDM